MLNLCLRRMRDQNNLMMSSVTWLHSRKKNAEINRSIFHLIFIYLLDSLLFPLQNRKWSLICFSAFDLNVFFSQLDTHAYENRASTLFFFVQNFLIHRLTVQSSWTVCQVSSVKPYYPFLFNWDIPYVTVIAT